MKFGTVRVAMVGLLAMAGLAGCEGASASLAHDGGHEGSVTYGGSSGGLGLLGAGGSSGGGDDATASASDDASSAASDSAASGDSGEASSEAGPGTSHIDGGTTPASACEPPEGGAPCDPGRVVCGSTSCDTAAQYCCAGGGSGASSDVCYAFNGASCPSSALTVACDETADCANSVCCEENVGAGMQGPSQCMTACPSGWFRLCKSDRECGDGDGGGSLNRCVVQTCSQLPGLLGGGSSVTIEACAVPATLGNLGNHGALPGCVAH